MTWDREWQSPRLGIRLVWAPETELGLYFPNEEPFLAAVELAAERERERWLRVEQERQQHPQAEQAVQQEREQRVQAEERAARLAAQLRVLGLEPD